MNELIIYIKNFQLHRVNQLTDELTRLAKINPQTVPLMLSWEQIREMAYSTISLAHIQEVMLS